MTRREDLLLDKISELLAEVEQLKLAILEEKREVHDTCPLCEAHTINGESIIAGLCKWEEEQCDPCAVCGGCVCTPG